MSRAVGRRIAGRRSIFATALIATLLLALPALCRAATTITVTSTADTSSANCVLRDAITVANDGGGTVNGCTAGSGTAYIIQFASGVTGTIFLNSSLPAIANTSPGSLTINGPTTSPGIAIDGRVEDYFENGKRAWLRLHEKGGKRHEVPCHHNLATYLDAWINAAGIAAEKKGPLFRAIRKGNKLTENPMAREDVLAMIKRRAKAAALPYSTCCHTFRATGITTYMQNGGTLEHAQQIAAHESPPKNKLYDRTQDDISLDEVERIRI